MQTLTDNIIGKVKMVVEIVSALATDVGDEITTDTARAAHYRSDNDNDFIQMM